MAKVRAAALSYLIAAVAVLASVIGVVGASARGVARSRIAAGLIGLTLGIGLPAMAAFTTVDGINYSTTCTASGTTPQTCNGATGIVTSASLSTAAATASTYVINNTQVVAASRVVCNLQSYSGVLVTNGYPTVFQCVAGAGTITVNFANTHASNAMSGTVGFAFTVSN